MGLKTFTFGLGQYTENGSPCVVAFDDDENPRLASDEKFYLKSEADKVIADKDAEIADLIEKNKRLANKDMIMASETIKGVFDALRHQKYKRCLAMAQGCVEKYENYSLLANEACQRGCYKSEARWDRLADKWLSRKSRWLELAEKFKEAK